jgi:ABC-type anion transport system duplicated permease subunit
VAGENPEPPRADIAARKRVALVGGLCALVVFMLVPVLAAFTTVFDGHVGSIGAGYVAGAFAIVFPVFGALAYARWADRREDER